MDSTIIENILTPFPGDICGVDVSFEYIIDQIKKARTTEDPDAPVGIWQAERQVADWKKVINLSLEVLQKQSKDLQVLFWLSEALYNTRGWSGLLESLDITADFLNTFEDNIFPREKELRANIIEGFIKKLTKDSIHLPLYADTDVTFEHPGTPVGKISYKDVIENVCEKLELCNVGFQNVTDEKFYIIDNLRSTLNNILALFPKEEITTDTLNTSVDLNPPNIESLANEAVSDINKELEISETNNDILSDQEPLEDTYHLTTQELYSVENVFEKIEEIAQFLEEHLPQTPVPILLRIALKLQYSKFSDIMKASGEHEPIINYISKLLNALEPGETSVIKREAPKLLNKVNFENTTPFSPFSSLEEGSDSSMMMPFTGIPEINRDF